MFAFTGRAISELQLIALNYHRHTVTGLNLVMLHVMEIKARILLIQGNEILHAVLILQILYSFPCLSVFDHIF